MDRRDYILRMIEELGRALIALRKRLLGGEVDAEAAGRRLESVAREAGLDLDVARVVTADTLLALVAPTGDVEPGRCWLYAETLYLDGLTAQLEERPEAAVSSFRKARFLFSLVKPMGVYLVGLPEADGRIREIDERLAALEELDEGARPAAGNADGAAGGDRDGSPDGDEASGSRDGEGTAGPSSRGRRRGRVRRRLRPVGPVRPDRREALLRSPDGEGRQGDG